MSDPERLSLGCESDVERALLRAGRGGAPPGARQRALLAASATLAASSLVAGGAAAGHAATVAKAGSIAAFKWIGLLSVVGVGAAASAVAVHDAHENARRMSIAATAASSPIADSRRPTSNPATIPTMSAEPESEATEAVPVATTSRHGPVRSAPKSTEPGASSASTLPVELAMIERARGAMGAGDLARALSILDGYAVRFPRGAMAPEAAVLRVEVLVKAGDRPAATRFANAFLAREPRSPYALRIQSLLAASNP